MDKKQLIKSWAEDGLSASEIERKLDLLDQVEEDDVKPTLQEFQDRNIATISAVNDKVEVNSLALAQKKSIVDTQTDLDALEAKMTAYIDAKFSEIMTLHYDDGTTEDVKVGK